MILNRLGNKKKIAEKISSHFPKHSVYIEPFFGAGGMFFRKSMAKTNILNDSDREVYNLFKVAINQTEDLRRMLVLMPIHEELWHEWRRGHPPNDPVLRAVRFLFLSNFGYMGKPNTLLIGAGTPKIQILKNLDQTAAIMSNCRFTCRDFREVLKPISWRNEDEKRNTFVYADPPYLGTANNYEEGFQESDSVDLFEMLVNGGTKFAISEFDHPFIMGLADKYSLNVVVIGERQNLKNRRTEILVTNYKNQLSLF